jgi:hypothetical protein
MTPRRVFQHDAKTASRCHQSSYQLTLESDEMLNSFVALLPSFIG